MVISKSGEELSMTIDGNLIDDKISEGIGKNILAHHKCPSAGNRLAKKLKSHIVKEFSADKIVGRLVTTYETLYPVRRNETKLK